MITDVKELILDYNSFQFDRIHYIQTLGKVMRAKIAITYAHPTFSIRREKSK